MYPLFHSSGWRTSLIAWQAGATAVILGSGATGEVAAAVESEGVTQLMALPQTLRDLLSRHRAGEPRAFSVRHLNTGTEGVGADELRQWAEMFGLQGVRVHYGASEIGPATVLSAAGSVDAPTSVGCPWDGVSIRIVDPESGGEAPVGTPGEVRLRTPWMMAGYFNAPHLTEAAFEGGREAGWYRTGDLGCVDGEGRLFIVGRVNDAIRSGGEWVYPGEVEALLAGIPGIRTAAVVGVPHPRWGQRPVAYIECEPGVDVDPDVINAHCREGLAAYKCPDWVETVDELPRVGATDKIDRGRLRSDAQRREAVATSLASRVHESELR
jgi:acyl-CoA synthetase (AMP-forming)/AMP-acid ligase II